MPSKNGGEITVVSPGEIMDYLGESADDELGVTWYKIQTIYGDIGWISGNIIENY